MQTAQISEPPQGCKTSLKYMILRGAEGEKFGDETEASFRKLIRSQEEGFPNRLKTQLCTIMAGWKQQKIPGKPIPLRRGPDQDVPFFYTQNHFSKLQSCKSMI